MKTYRVKEIFFSLQGEGVRAGTPNLFLRFAKCNLDCRIDTHGFNCDTDFEGGESLTMDDIRATFRRLALACSWVILTGGEPALQVDRALIDTLHEDGYRLAIETNGTIRLPDGIDWITVSPKVPEEQLEQRHADEVKYVRAAGQPIPETRVNARYKLISPAFEGDHLDPATLEWCINLVRHHPDWRLSVQQHKGWGLP